MKEVVLHVGFAKTASTSIQNALAKNRDTLAKTGFSFARFTLGGREITNHSLALTYLFTDRGATHHVHVKRDLSVADERARAEKELDAALSQSDKVILSGETVPFFLREDLERIRDYFAERKIKLRVIGLVRPTLAFLTSLSQQLVKTGAPLQASHQKSPAKLMRHLIEVFPDAELYSFKDACQFPSGPVGFFLHQIGIDTEIHLEDAQDNPAWSDNAVRLCEHVNSFAPVVSKGRLNALRKERDLHAFSRIKGPRFALTKAELRSDDLQQEIDWMVSHYGEGFAEDLAGQPVEPHEWQQQQIVQAARAMDSIPLHLVPLVYNYFHSKARIAQGARIRPIVDMAHKCYFEH